MDNTPTLPAFHPQYQVFAYYAPDAWRKEHEAGTEEHAIAHRDKLRDAGQIAEVVKWEPSIVIDAPTPTPERRNPKLKALPE